MVNPSGAGVELTHQQQLFCEKYIECKGNASEAYRQSYNCTEASNNTIWTDAYKLLQIPYVAHRIQTLQDAHAERHKVTVDTLTEELDEAKAFAYSLEQPSAAITAIMGKAKIHGHDKASLALTGKDGGAIESSVTVRYVDGKDA